MAKMSNKQRIERFLDLLKHYGYKPYDEDYGNGYFIMEFGKDTVCWFKIKGCKGWKFGIWLNTLSKKKQAEEFEAKHGRKLGEYDFDEEITYELKFFFQYEKDIDKFKPSGSGDYNYCITNDDYETGRYNKDYKPQFIRGIDIVKKYPAVARRLETDNWQSVWSCRYDNFRSDLFELKQELKKWLKKQYVFMYVRLNKLEIAKYEIEDENKDSPDGWFSYPNYTIHYIPVKKILSDNDKYDKLDNKLEKLAKGTDIDFCGYESWGNKGED